MPKKPRTRASKFVKLPALEPSKSAVLNSLASLNSRRAYEYAIREFIDIAPSRGSCGSVLDDLGCRAKHLDTTPTKALKQTDYL